MIHKRRRAALIVDTRNKMQNIMEIITYAKDAFCLAPWRDANMDHEVLRQVKATD